MGSDAAFARPLVLVHGGLGDDMDADRFWVRPGIVDGLRSAGLAVTAPDRDTTPRSWPAAAEDMATWLAAPSTVMAGSNGVSVAVRLALDHPDVVARLVLLWPATAGDAQVDAAVPPEASHLLDGDTLRGIGDDELGALGLPVGVMASDPEDPFHRHHTVDRVLDLVPTAERITPAFPAPPRPEFAPRLDEFLAVIVGYLRSG